MTEPTTDTGPHPWQPKGWRRWICLHCYAPKSLHPRTDWGRSRPLHDNRYISPNAPHLNEGW
ncbi:hypothetical protein U9R90_05360 [Streptomyces sp. E11-3]|uniref:hypothetical protein n=1 Tax=Streptomyces sp. E11-3 TaxID=3110112 RepID=UPI00397FD069